ncbi:MAG: SYNERG-CTERM sorting domain-containing protein, partial [Synergistaceae bacterium]|nr:SYNERG-CTERM sorting domain-containing protein [Synergistaceae bacterium]
LDPEEENLPNLQLLSCDNQFQEGATFTDEMNFSDFTYEPYTSSEVSSSGYDDDEAGISWSFSKVQNLKAFDSSGKAIDAKYDKTTGTMTFAETPAKITYDYNTGFKNILMDVTVSSASSSKSLNSSSSGCNAGFGFMAVFALAGLSALLRKKS